MKYNLSVPGKPSRIIDWNTVGFYPEPADYQMLARSWLDPPLIETAGIRRVPEDTARSLLGYIRPPRKGRRFAGLVFPYTRPGSSEVIALRIRRDSPDLGTSGDGAGKPQGKYLAPRGAENHLYFPPGTVEPELRDTALPALLVEGEKKCLALHRLARFESATPRWLAVGLAGVWAWRGRLGGSDKTAPIKDLDRIAWRGRRVHVLYDADTLVNDGVAAARKALARELGRRGAEVRFVELPVVDDLNGADDFLASPSHGPQSVLELIQSAKPCDLAEPGDRVRMGSFQYRANPGRGIYLVTSDLDKDGNRIEKDTQLCNFTCRILGDTLTDDGAETSRLLDLESVIGNRTRRFQLPAQQFGSLNWVMEHVGGQAVIIPGNNSRDHVRTAIQAYGRDLVERTAYSHLGWRRIQDHWLYLHAGGAIGAQGTDTTVEVALPASLSAYRLPSPPMEDRLRSAIQAALALLNVAPDSVSIPLFLLPWRAVLGGCDFSVHLSGETGAGKTELAARVQQFFGPEMVRMHLPGNWSSTPNYLEQLAFCAKDAVVTIDDFVHAGGRIEAQRLNYAADRLIRGQGNSAGRGRLRSDSTAMSPRPPRGLVVSTGEETPGGHSLRSRMLVLEVGPQDVRWDVMTRCQLDGAAGLYAEALAAFISWLAPRYADFTVNRESRLAELRERYSRELPERTHKRVGANFGNLLLALEAFAGFALNCRAMSLEEVAALRRRAVAAFASLASGQDRQQRDAEPTGRFLELLQSVLTAGRGHFAPPDGREPTTPDMDGPMADPYTWGWSDPGGCSCWQPRGDRLGWIDRDGLYLDPAAAFRAVRRLADDTGEPFPVTLSTLKRRLRIGSFWHQPMRPGRP